MTMAEPLPAPAFVVGPRSSPMGSIASIAKLEARGNRSQDDDLSSLAETASVDSSDGVAAGPDPCAPLHRRGDRRGAQTAAMAPCPSCQQRQLRQSLSGRGPRAAARDATTTFTRCEVRRHASEASCWLVAGDTVYDATDMIQAHPGGRESILKKGGGVEDCSRDIHFHSQRGREMWKRRRIGKLIDCGKESHPGQWWMFWSSA